MTHAFTLKLIPQTKIQESGSDLLIATPPRHGVRLNNPSPARRTILNELANDGGRIESLIEAGSKAEPSANTAVLYYFISQLEARGLLNYSLQQRQSTRITLIPYTREWQLAPARTEAHYQASRFSCLNPEQGQWHLHAPLGHAGIEICDPELISIYSQLAQPASLHELAGNLPQINANTIRQVITLLLSAGVIESCDENQQISEQTSPTLQRWNFHDVLFHSASRMGRRPTNTFGATFRFAGKQPPLPARKPPGAGPRISLPKPSAQLEQPGLFDVINQRRSIREYHEQPLSRDDLATLLWHTYRVRSSHPADPKQAASYEATFRPVAGGGAAHEIEMYLNITRCDGLDAGLYRYDGFTHELEWIRSPNADTQDLIADAMGAAMLENPPDVLITLAARFGRMNWKYENMAYAAILKHVGVIYQQLYLVATALNLAPCGLGAGNSDTFARAAGTDYFEETSVGEFALGARKPS